MALDALIFDLDGTLVDTNGLHTRAWRDSLVHHGFAVGADRVALEIGKGGSMLVPFLLGKEAEEACGDALRDYHAHRYLELVEEAGAPVLPRVRDLFEALRERGLRIAIATASKTSSLKKVVEVSGLDLFDLADVVITDSDVERSKPHPDVVHAAARKLGVSPAQCVFVGDTPYDVEAGARAGVAVLSVLTGVHEAEALRRTGARAAYRDAADLLGRLDEALRLASPYPARLTPEAMESLMREALAVAREGLEGGHVPVGAVLARGDGTVVARAHDTTQADGPAAHAVPNVLRAAGTADDAVLLATTAAPCAMCAGALQQAGVDTVVYAEDVPDAKSVRPWRPIRPGVVPPRVVGGVLRDESRRLLERFLEKHPEAASLRRRLAGEPASAPA